MKKLQLIIEKDADGYLWGRIEGKGDFMPTGQGKTTKALINNIKAGIALALETGKDKFWSKIDIDNIEPELVYDLQAFFAAHAEVNISAIAERAGINPSLLRQYTSGMKYPSGAQVKKIETAIRELGKELSKTKLLASAA